MIHKGSGSIEYREPKSGDKQATTPAGLTQGKEYAWGLWLIDFMRSKSFMLAVAIFSVLWLTPNTYYVYISFSAFESPWRELAGAGIALIVAASIMIYTIRKNEKVAYYYSLFEISISAYYYISMIGWDWGLIPALSLTIMLPISVKGYTSEIKEQEGIEAIEQKQSLTHKELTNKNDSRTYYNFNQDDKLHHTPVLTNIAVDSVNSEREALEPKPVIQEPNPLADPTLFTPSEQRIADPEVTPPEPKPYNPFTFNS